MENTNDTAGQEKIAGTNLTTVPEYSQTALGLIELRQKHANVVYDVTNPKEMKAAKEARAELRTLRTTLEKTRKEIKAPALERCRQIDDEAKRLTLEISSLEDPIDQQIKAEEARAEAERIAKAQAEQARIDEHKAAIQRFRDFPLSLQGRPAEVIDAKIEYFSLDATFGWADKFEEFEQEARDAYGAALGSAREVLQRQREHEAEQEQVRKDRERLEAQERELAQLRREKEEAEERERQREREESERIEREQREAEQNEVSRVRRIRERIEWLENFGAFVSSAQALEAIDEAIRSLAEHNPAISGYEYAEFLDDAGKAYMEALKRLEYIRKERENFVVEQERQAEVERQQRAEAERLDAIRKDQEIEAESIRVQNLGLRQAAMAAYDLLINQGFASHRVTKDLGAVLDRDPERRDAAKPVKTPRTHA